MVDDSAFPSPAMRKDKLRALLVSTVNVLL
jgi:hypothetical protein